MQNRIALAVDGKPLSGKRAFIAFVKVRLFVVQKLFSVFHKQRNIGKAFVFIAVSVVILALKGNAVKTAYVLIIQRRSNLCGNGNTFFGKKHDYCRHA